MVEFAKIEFPTENEILALHSDGPKHMKYSHVWNHFV